jgi:hypothetical protein
MFLFYVKAYKACSYIELLNVALGSYADLESNSLLMYLFPSTG